MKRSAYLMVRDAPPYRHDAFMQGLSAAGLAISRKIPQVIKQTDVLVIWNRYGANHAIARRFEDVGAAVFVAENGYINFAGTKKTFALALNHHNGAGHWPVPQVARDLAFDIDVAPDWISDGTGDLWLLPQRGVGPPGVAMPRGWISDVQGRLVCVKKDRSVHVRQHPGTAKPRTLLADDLRNNALAVTWASGAALKALALGVPVVFEMSRWIGKPAGSFGLQTVRNPQFGDRRQALHNVAWAQWTVEEIAAGEPFTRLLEYHENRRSNR